jgi:hypothetical protein
MVRNIGRKIDVLKLDGFDPVDIKFHSDSSTFTAEFLGKGFSNKDLNLLKLDLKAEADACTRTVWKPVIKINVGHWESDRSSAGFTIEKKMLGSFAYPGGSIKTVLADVVYKESMIGDDFYDDPRNWHPHSVQREYEDDDEDVKIINATKERYRTLLFIEEQIRKLKTQLRNVINSDKSEDFLDSLYNNKHLFLRDEFSKKNLLPAAEAE